MLWQVGAVGIRLDSLEARVDVLEIGAIEQSKNIPPPEETASKVPTFVSTTWSKNSCDGNSTHVISSPPTWKTYHSYNTNKPIYLNIRSLNCNLMMESFQNQSFFTVFLFLYSCNSLISRIHLVRRSKQNRKQKKSPGGSLASSGGNFVQQFMSLSNSNS